MSKGATLGYGRDENASESKLSESDGVDDDDRQKAIVLFFSSVASG